MSKVEASAVERIIAHTINETAQGDPDALAARVVAALAEAGFLIVSASGTEDTALLPQPAEMRQLYRSPNGDSWFLVLDPATGSAFRQASGECAIRRSGDRYRSRRVPSAAQEVPSTKPYCA